MSLLDQLTGVLDQYTHVNPQQPPAHVESDFEHVAQNSPRETLAEGLSHAFRSDQTPAFGQMVSQLFSRSNPEQRSGLLSTLLGSLGPSALGQLGSQGGGISNLLSAFQNGSLSPAHASQVSPQTVETIANHAEQHNPSIVDEVSHFYSQHPTLVKTLGAGVLALAMSKMAQRGRA